MLAAYNGKIKIVQKLISYGADIGIKASNGNSAIDYGNMNPDPIIKQLIRQALYLRMI